MLPGLALRPRRPAHGKNAELCLFRVSAGGWLVLHWRAATTMPHRQGCPLHDLAVLYPAAASVARRHLDLQPPGVQPAAGGRGLEWYRGAAQAPFQPDSAAGRVRAPVPAACAELAKTTNKAIAKNAYINNIWFFCNVLIIFFP